MAAAAAVRPLADVLTEHVAAVQAERVLQARLAAMDTPEKVAADAVAAAEEALTCAWPLKNGDDCEADRTLFAVGGAALVPDDRLGTVVHRDGTPTVIVCAAHVVAAVSTSDYHGACSVVMAIAEHPLRGRPTSSS